MTLDGLPLVQDRLEKVGIAITSTHDLYLLATDEDRTPIQTAISVLIDLLPCLKTSAVKGAVAQALAVKESRGLTAQPLITELKKLRHEIEEKVPYATQLGWEIANALADVATDSVYDEVVEVLVDQRFGRSRKMLPYALARVKKRRDQTVNVLVRVLHDDGVAAHAINALGRLKATETLPRIRAFLDAPKYLVRKEAKKAVKKLENILNKSSLPRKQKPIKSLPPGTPEVSLNIDLCDVSRLLKAAATQIAQGFGSPEIQQLEEEILTMEIEDDRLYDFDVVFNNAGARFQIEVFMDDESSPDLFFRGNQSLIDAIDRVLDEWSEADGDKESTRLPTTNGS